MEWIERGIAGHQTSNVRLQPNSFKAEWEREPTDVAKKSGRCQKAVNCRSSQRGFRKDRQIPARSSGQGHCKVLVSVRQ
ncbi:hypothetical protein JTE90_021652 [Oedothorax gibbosus]|uniref:Uncharacterized protein n=1 Tax=Oedothorax gibbosus TaxID=931172 RepID=A0AAV6VQS9_9ARAC|nr:hypothetical protein JTE90_021652 [Oedothorax gibbosus]